MVSKVKYNWIMWIATAAMVVSLGIHASGVVRLLSEKDTAPVVRPDHAEAVEPQIDMDSVLALMPFGRPVEAPQSNAAPALELRFKLLGVVRADPISRSSAILSVGTEPARSYLVGDEIANGRRLVEVQGDHVLLQVGNVREKVLLFETPPPTLPQSDSVARTAGTTGDFDALRQLIFDQVNSQGDTAPVPLPRDETSN